jgi:hypothetical protein
MSQNEDFSSSGSMNAIPSSSVRFSRIQPAWHLMLLSILTSGLYLIYWFWRSWSDLRREAGLNVSPGWRTVCMVVPILDIVLTIQLFREIEKIASTRKAEPLASPTILALSFCLLSYIATWFSIRSAFPNAPSEMMSLIIISYAFSIPAILLLIPVQRTFNRYWAATQPELPVRTAFTAGEIVMLLAGAVLTVSTIIFPPL